MTRSTRSLAAADVAAFSDTCRCCAFWESEPHQRRGRAPEEVASLKGEWLAATSELWGSCGLLLTVDGGYAGHVLYAPEALIPGAGSMPTTPLTPGTIHLMSAWVDPAHRGRGLGKLLVQATARDLICRGVSRTVEVVGESRPGDPHQWGSCTLPTGFLEAVGFEMRRAHPTNPRLRMNLRSALTWREEVDVRWQRFVVAVRPSVTAPKPGRAGAIVGSRLSR